MSFFALLVLAFAMSMDAFAVAIAKGVILGKVSIWRALRIGILFGLIEGITPLIGWGLGKLAHQWIEQWDHWLAFALLLGLGLKVCYESLQHDDSPTSQPTTSPKFYLLILTAIGTSLDAMTVGVSLAFLDVSILLATLMIGLATCVMVSSGVMLGHSMRQNCGKYAEFLGGIVLIVIGSFILIDHLYLA
ncbi:MAG: manganese efflux pump MntP family protein [Acinetobacter sp.]|nr:manganese efflux pump MntP family protein [Acinetobacter sp.]